MPRQALGLGFDTYTVDPVPPSLRAAGSGPEAAEIARQEFIAQREATRNLARCGFHACLTFLVLIFICLRLHWFVERYLEPILIPEPPPSTFVFRDGL